MFPLLVIKAKEVKIVKEVYGDVYQKDNFLVIVLLNLH